MHSSTSLTVDKHFFLFQNILEFSQSTKFMQVFIKRSQRSNLEPDPVLETRPSPEEPLQTSAHTHPCENPGSHGRKGQRQGFSSELLTALNTAPNTLSFWQQFKYPGGWGAGK